MNSSHPSLSPSLSLRTKVGRIITGFSFFMVVFYSYMLLQLKDSGLRDATHSVLIHESQLYIEAYSQDPTTALPHSYSLKGFIGAEALPPSIREVFPPDARDTWHQRKSGVYYKFTVDDKYFSHHHLYLQILPNTNEELFMYYRYAQATDSHFDIWRNVKQVALLGFVLVIVMLFFLRDFIHRALSPISSLSQWISKIADKEKPDPLPGDIQDDEIGQLANNLFHALERIHESNNRERAFLRNASHELRTPIAIIRNTMDVIEHKTSQGSAKDVDRLLQRIRRASDTMKAVTEAILWLALEDYATPSETESDLKLLLDEVIEENRNLLAGKDINIIPNYDALGKINCEQALTHITLDNLIRNAFQHCSGGEIRVNALSEFSIEINNARFDSTDEIKENNHHVSTGGFGLGLALVKSIADKKQWEFEFKLENNIAVAQLTFS